MMHDTKGNDRPKFWACKFCRLLADQGVANDIGVDGTYLLTVIVHQEDAIRYSRPVSFWRDALIRACGFKNESKLKRVRKKVVEAGWLEYKAGRKGRAAQYRVRVPEAYVDSTFWVTSEPEFTEVHHVSGSPVNQKAPLCGSPVNRNADPIQTGTVNPNVRELKFTERDASIASDFYQKLLVLNPKHKKPNLGKWSETVRLMREQDNRTYEEIEALIEWVHRHDFWKSNVQSPGKLREKFDQLTIGMRNPPPSAKQVRKDKPTTQLVDDGRRRFGRKAQ